MLGWLRPYDKRLSIPASPNAQKESLAGRSGAPVIDLMNDDLIRYAQQRNLG